MSQQLPRQCCALLLFQRGIIARWQAPAAGLSTHDIQSRIRAGRWRPLLRGVYATFTGDPPREAMLWAAVLRGGPQAALSHETAAELDGLLDTRTSLIHVTLPHTQPVRYGPGFAVHRSRRIEQSRHPGLLPPRTMIEETVLDLAQEATAFDDAFSWASRACQRGLTTPMLLRIRMDMRKSMRWRSELGAGLEAIWAGAHSALEFRYLRDVERPHLLPRGVRQARIWREGRRQYRDVEYEEFGVCVELDGRDAHPSGQRWRDIRRDNANAAEGIITLRYGWADVTQRPCHVAAEVGKVLQTRGWQGLVRPCGPACPLRSPNPPHDPLLGESGGK